MAKEKFPGIPAVTDDRSIATTVRVLVEVIELLIGQRGSGNLRAATKQDLAKVGITLPENTSGN